MLREPVMRPRTKRHGRETHVVNMLSDTHVKRAWCIEIVVR